jgi:DNA replication initiation complex subunit (GINS family)
MTEKTEEQKVDEFKQKLEEHETEQKEAAEKNARLFDPKAISESAKQIQTLMDKDLGEVRYGLLTSKEFKALNLGKVTDEEEQAYRVVHAMLQKANPDFSFEDFEAMPFDIKAILTERLTMRFPLFLRQQQLSGSQQTKTPSCSA